MVESYENYREEERLSTNNARRIEFLTTVRALDELIVEKKKMLDCAVGTGVYAFYLADKEHDVTATDITPRHIEVIKEVVKNKPYEMEARVLDATDMSVFEDFNGLKFDTSHLDSAMYAINMAELEKFLLEIGSDFAFLCT